ncbi:PASTA domain-containing protein [Neobacillus bataviensis]|uniref:PASTA domain-containing protein n=1 Tax=Neobacillus bataviensis TaxID=220685 RepID=UPI0034DB2EB7
MQVEKVRVPNLVGMQGRQARDLLLSMGLNPKNDLVRANANVKKDIVIRQSPDPNKEVLKGSNVEIHYNYDFNGILWKPH